MYGTGMSPTGPYIDPQTGLWVLPNSGPVNTQNGPQGAAQPAQDGLIRVTGMQGAKAYQMPANSRAALFDDTDDIVIIKMTDGAGFPSYRRARLEWIEDELDNDPVTRSELNAKFEELKGLILNGKQSVRRGGKGAAAEDAE